MPIVTLSKGAQIGGTIIATVLTLGSLDLDPRDFLYVHPTEENARRWSRLKLSPLLRGSARLREIFPEKSRNGADSVMFSRLKANSVVNWFVALFHELGYEGCSSHSGRRSFITMAARNVHRTGCSLRDVQLLAGHPLSKSPSATSMATPARSGDWLRTFSEALPQRRKIVAFGDRAKNSGFESPQLHQLLLKIIVYSATYTRIVFDAPTNALILPYDVVNPPRVLHFLQHLRFGAFDFEATMRTPPGPRPAP